MKCSEHPFQKLAKKHPRTRNEAMIVAMIVALSVTTKYKKKTFEEIYDASRLQAESLYL